jgi:hypothetical protein
MLLASKALAPLMVQDDTKKPGNTPAPASTAERWNYAGADEVVSVHLLRKYAESIDGVNLEKAVVGDRLELPPRDANILIAEGWAVRADDERLSRLLPRALAADNSRRSRKKSKT